MNLHDRAKAVRSKLKKNGGPLATEAADVIGKLLKEIPEPTTGKLHAWHRRIVLMFHPTFKKDTRDSAEIRLFIKTLPLMTEEGLRACEYWRAKPEPKGFDKHLSPRKSTPSIFMRNYEDQEAFALEYCAKFPAARPKKAGIPELQGWQDIAPGNLGNRSWDQVCKQYPDIAKDICKQLSG